MAIIEVKCRFCQETKDVKKHGLGKGGYQRYRCQLCCKTFQLEYSYRACHAGIKEQIVDLAMNNSGIRDSARVLNISINSVVRVLKNLNPGV